MRMWFIKFSMFLKVILFVSNVYEIYFVKMKEIEFKVCIKNYFISMNINLEIRCSNFYILYFNIF